MKFEVVNGEQKKPEEKMYLRLKEMSAGSFVVEIATDPTFTTSSNNLLVLDVFDGKLSVRPCGFFSPEFTPHVLIEQSTGYIKVLSSGERCLS